VTQHEAQPTNQLYTYKLNTSIMQRIILAKQTSFKALWFRKLWLH